jgi:hypothetical protein
MSGTWRLHRGTEEERLAGLADFSVPVRTFQQMAINYANRHKSEIFHGVRTEVIDEHTIILEAKEE